MMSDMILDCSGLSCPEPVRRTKNYIVEHAPKTFAVIVDNDAAKENVSRMLGKQGYDCTVCADGAKWRLEAVRNGSGAEPSPAATSCEVMHERSGKTIVFLSGPGIGRGDDELAVKLLRNFLRTLPEFGPELWRIMIVNKGVLMAVEGSPVLDEFKTLEKAGVGVMVCGSCLEHLGLTGKLAVGEITNMLDIVTGMQLADKVISI